MAALRTLPAAFQSLITESSDSDAWKEAFSAQGFDVPAPEKPQPRIRHGRASGGCRSNVLIGDLYAAELSTTFEHSWLSKLPGIKRGCGSCKDLQTQMNRDGHAAVSRKREQIIDATCKNLGAILTWVPASIGRLYTTSDSMRRAVADCFDRAMAKVPKPVVRVRRHGRRRGMWAVNPNARFVTSAQMQEDIKTLISKLPPDITAIAGVARSGLAVATMVSMHTHLPMLTIRQTMGDIQQTGNGWRLGGNKHVNPRTQKIAIIDDTVMTGNSLKAIEPIVRREFGNCITAVVYVNPQAAKKPDVWAVELPSPHLLEWNLFNSVFSPNTAMDFDGILCHDCPAGSDDDGPNYLEFIRNAPPLYVPRRVPIPLVVTARIERYRQETQEWLQRHGIRVNRLVMHPAKTLKERQRADIASWKAGHFIQWAKRHKRTGPPPTMFVESEDWQAQGIARHVTTAGMRDTLIVCPGSGKVY